jgi:HEAT repeat protein
MAAALGMIAITWRFHRAYVSALADSLRRGLAPLGPLEMVDSTILLSLGEVPPRDPSRAAAPSGAPAAPPGSVENAALRQAAALASNDPAQIRAALVQGLADAVVVAAAVPLLARDDLFAEVIPALRKAGARFTGQLLDTLLDPAAEPVVRRRTARVLASATTQRAADGLLAAMECERFDVRYRAAQALTRLRHRGKVKISAARVVAAAEREVTSLTDRVDRTRLDHVTTLLSLALDGEPIGIAVRALRGQDPALRGTALEYLDHVLPPTIRDALLPKLGAPASPRERRSVDTVRDELLRSSWRWTAGDEGGAA